MEENATKAAYESPKLVKYENIRELTCESGCPDWQCSVMVDGLPIPPKP